MSKSKRPDGVTTEVWRRLDAHGRKLNRFLSRIKKLEAGQPEGRTEADRPLTPGSVNVDWLDEGRESCLIDGVRYRASAAAGYAVERLLACWEASLKDWTTMSNELVGDAGMVRQLREAIEADRREGREGYEERWAVEHKQSGKLTTRARYGDDMVRFSESSAKRYTMGNEDVFRVVKILVPIDQHPDTEGET